MRRIAFALGLAAAATFGAGLGWFALGPWGEMSEPRRAAGEAVARADSATVALARRKAELEQERARLAGGVAPAVKEERVAPRTVEEHLDFLSRLVVRKMTSRGWSRSLDRFEAALAADPVMLAAYLDVLSRPGDRRAFAVSVLADMSYDFKSRPEIAAFARTLAQDESAQAIDRAMAIGLASSCWEAGDPSAWATLSRLAQFDREELVRNAALVRLERDFADDPRTKRLLSDSWWREADPVTRAVKLGTALGSMEGAERAETIARALREDRASEVKAAAAARLFQEMLSPERLMTPDQRKAAIDAALGELTPHADRELRRALVVSVLAAGDESHLRRLADYLSAQEPDAKLKAWGESTVEKLLAPGASRDEEFLRSLWDSLEDLGGDSE